MVTILAEMYRSRLQRLEDRRTFRKAILILLATFALVVFLAIAGLPLLIRLAVFLGDLRTGRADGEPSDIIPPPPPRISLVFEATNSANLRLPGTAEPGSSISLTLNGAGLNPVKVGEDGRFVFENIKLIEGLNTFVATAVDDSGNKSLESQSVRVSYINKEPKLLIEKPVDGTIIKGKNSTIEVGGKIDPGNRLLLNERLVLVNANGDFKTTYKLSSGDNKLVFVVSDTAGNLLTKEVFVKYENN